LSSVTIVIPAYNEALIIGNTITELLNWLPEPGYELVEVIVVDDGSFDDTAEVTHQFVKQDTRVKLLQNSGNMGKGFSIRKGVLTGQGDLIGFTDADLAYKPFQYNAFVKKLHDGSDVVVGSRRISTDSGLQKYPWRRQYATHIFQMLISLLGLTTVSDSQCGVKFLKASEAKNLFSSLKCNGFAFDVELLYLAKQYGMTVDEVPVKMDPQRPSTIQLRNQVPKMLMDLIAIRFRKYEDRVK